MSAAKQPASSEPRSESLPPDGSFPFSELPWSLGSAAINPPVSMWVELLRFGAQRLEAQANFWQEVCACRDVGGALKQQMTFLNDAATAYAREATALTEKAREPLRPPQA